MARKTKRHRNTRGKTPHECSIAGIGAASGGLEAFQDFLRHLPADLPVAFVFVPHPDLKPMEGLVERISQATRMPVKQAGDQMRVRPGRVYVIPPNCDISIRQGTLTVTPRDEEAETCMPADHFLASLAVDQKSRAIGVILSGNGADGALGIKAIKSEGGLTFVQDPGTAHAPGMPRSAAESGGADYVLPVPEIARELARLCQFSREPDDHLVNERHGLDRIFTMIQSASGTDFSDYKTPTIKRRIVRRMALLKLQTLEEYIKYLKENPDEIHDLYHDILIRVTRFFRDPQIYWALTHKVFPAVLKHRSAEEPVRVWVPGCASGEEVYSIAICLLELLGKKASRVPIQIFGTDISEIALRKARAGTYPLNISMDVSEERLARFFIKTDGKYTINKAIRDMCVFARQDVTRDPPFSKMDVISCRNLLIYLSQNLQNKVFSIFHYALKPSGFLVLGTSESVHGFTDRFTVKDKQHNIYSKRLLSTRPPVHFQSGPRGLPIPDKVLSVQKKPIDPTWAEFDIQREMDRIILNKYSPVSVLINDEMDILQTRGRISQYLELAPGKVSLNLMKMAREGLLVDLRPALEKARKKGVAAQRKSVRVKSGGQIKTVDLEVIPISGPFHRERYYLVLFQEPPAAALKPLTRGELRKLHRRLDDRNADRLQEELALTKEYLQRIIEDQETTNEELKAANEETLSSNEELQSTNEELETAKEELQSTNEELATVNDELKLSLDQLKDLNEQLEQAQGIARLGSWTWNIKSNAVAWSDELYRIYGLAPQEIVLNYEGFLARVHPEDKAAVKSAVEKALRTGKPFDLIHRIVRPNRTVRTLHARGRLIKDRAGRAVRMVGTGHDVTDLLQMQQALRESEERFRLMVEWVQDYAIFAMDPDGVITSWNSGAEKLKGYKAEEIIGQRFSRFYPEEDRRHGKPDRILAAAVKKGRVENEGWRVRKDGSRFWADAVITALKDKNGKLLGFTKITRDLTERRRADEALRKAYDELEARVEQRTRELAKANEELKRSEKNLSDFFENATVGLHWVGPDGTILRANRAELDMLGYKAEEYVGRNIREFHADAEVISDILQKLSSREELHNYEARMRCKDGSVKHVLISSNVLWEGGRFVHARCFTRDITERKRSESALRRQNERLRLLSDAVRHLLSTHDPGAMVRGLFDRVAAHMDLDAYFNFMVDEKGEALRLESCSGIPEGEIQKISRLEFGQAVCGNVALQRKPIEAVHIQESDDPKVQLVKSYGIRAYFCNPLMVGDRLIGTLSFASKRRDEFTEDEREFLSTICHYVAMAKERARFTAELERGVKERTADLTRLNKELENARDQALASVQAKAQFLANMSHEIRTPLNAVIGMAGLLIETPLSNQQKEFAQIVRDSGDSLLSIINSILDFSKIEAGKLALDEQDFDLGALVGGTVGLFALEAENKGLRLHSQFEDGLPAALRGDAGRLRQVLMNLLGNAVKFTERGEVRVRVGLESETAEDAVIRVDVSDTGIGINEEGVEHLFQPFTQADASTTRRFGGTGLGLAISKQIVELMGGSIGVTSRRGEGSTFWITVPFIKQAGGNGAPLPAAAAPGPWMKKSVRVLVAEDNSVNRRVVTAQLDRLGARTEAVSNGRAAVEAVRAGAFDLILMDCQMPEMDGYTATAEIRKAENGKRVPIVALTAHALAGDRDRCLAAGMDDYIAKPVHMEDLVAVLAKWMGEGRSS